MKGKRFAVVITFLAVLVYAVVLGLGAPSAWAQVAVSGQITGLVTDGSQAVVPGAAVNAKNDKTNVVSKTVTNQSGAYSILSLIPGTYTLTVEQGGFRKFIRENVVVGVDVIIRVDVTLEVGLVTEEIKVTGEAPILKTEKSDVSQSIDRNQVENLPTLGRNVMRLQTLVPGAVIGPGQLFGHPENASEDYRVNFNGLMNGTTNRQLDGVDNNEVIQGLSMVVPTQDSVQEMKITTSNYDAEYGTVAGAFIQISTRSGTNDLHGSAFEFYRSSGMFARDPFTEPKRPASFIWHQFGGSLGGPIRKDKLFVFGDVQGMRSNLGGSSLVTSPVAAFRNGDFSALAATNPIFDPLTGNPDGTGRIQFSDPSRATESNPLGLNIIPQSRISSVATRLLALVPFPNNPARLDNNHSVSGRGLFNQNQYNIRMDYNLSDRSRIMGRYTLFRTKFDTPNVFGPVAGGAPLGGISNSGQSATQTQSMALGLSRVFSPTLLADVRFGFSRLRIDTLNFDKDLKTAETSGIPGVNIGGNPVYTNGLPRMNVSGPVGAWAMGSFGGPFFERETVFNVISSFTKIIGNHSVKWGADIKKVFFIRTDANGRGDFGFAQAVTGRADRPGSGIGMASFLLGLPATYTRRITNVLPQEKQWRDGIYIQNNWKVTRKLTLNLGLRWEYHSPMFTSEGAPPLTNLDTNTGMILLTTAADKYAGIPPIRDEFSPRFGLAYQLTGNTVIRTGFGRSYAIAIFGGTFATQAGSYPNSQPQELLQVNPFTPVIRFENGPPAPAAIPAFPPSGQVPLPPGVPFTYPGTGQFPHQYTDSWNFTVQHQIGKSSSFEVGYVGNASRKIWSNINPNAPTFGPGSFNSRRPFFQKFGWFQNMTLRRAGLKANYHSLQARLQKNFSSGLSAFSNFTWSKGIDEGTTGPMNQFDIRGSRSPSDLNRDFVSVSSFVWDLPFGSGKPVGSQAKGVVRHLIEGWSTNAIVNLMSGRYLTPVMGNNASLNSTVQLRPDRAGSGEVSDPTRNKWFDVTAFRTPALYTYGNSGRNILLGPGFASVDLAVFKAFRVSERVSLQVRWEALNAFNRTNLNNPNTTIDAAAGGGIFGLVHPMRRMQIGGRLEW